MNSPQSHKPNACIGIRIRHCDTSDLDAACRTILTRLDALDLHPQVLAETGKDALGPFFQIRLNDAKVQEWAPGFDTLQLCQTLRLDTQNRPADLLREIVLGLLMGPLAYDYPSLDELVSAVNIRRNIVLAGRKTSLAFGTAEADRPEQFWTYDDDEGFVILPGVSLIAALVHATQPEVSGHRYAFSCYRATEYVILLGIAQELAQCNPSLFQQLQDFWTTRTISSGQFHDVFLHEQGSMEQPLPQRYFVPGDRTWFRNPDEASADASGFEGSWVMYLGGGLFTNFWTCDQPYTLTRKCVEVYHWRHGLYLDEDGEPRIDEGKIAPLIEATLRDPDEMQKVMAVMERYREARGMYTDAGGCIDTTREFARWVCPGTSNLLLPST